MTETTKQILAKMNVNVENRKVHTNPETMKFASLLNGAKRSESILGKTIYGNGDYTLILTKDVILIPGAPHQVDYSRYQLVREDVQ